MSDFESWLQPMSLNIYMHMNYSPCAHTHTHTHKHTHEVFPSSPPYKLIPLFYSPSPLSPLPLLSLYKLIPLFYSLSYTWHCVVHETCLSVQCEWVMAHMWMSHGTYVHESWHICEWVMAHMWMSHGTYVNESWQICEWANVSRNVSKSAMWLYTGVAGEMTL